MNSHQPVATIQIVAAQPDDALEIAKLQAQSWREVYPGVQPEITQAWVDQRAALRTDANKLEERKEAIADAQAHPEQAMYMLAKRTDGHIVGYISAKKKDTEQKLIGLYIEQEYRGQGVARQLMQCFLDWLDPSQPAVLWVTKGNIRAITFYEKYNFKLVEEAAKPHQAGSPMVVVKMIRKGENS